MYVWVKSVVYLAIFGGVGYGLLELTTPSEDKLKQFRQPGLEAEEKGKKALFMKKIQEASREEPIYLKKKSD
ncbi:uncharacterized protein LOC120902410 [Anopheles arabiensis]|uniref:Ubiquinol-cytochrome-c reductase complex assembly factor 3 n=4 Tax=gambiae species complex TaxID=44542 RepID=A0A453Z055_ANOGA|nr:uncharacterized protein LOC120902410 [Anopheles arabiensis]XP_040231946.1 uncharacterized protein LOC120955292 [Anopheles coluzzii]XP_041780080.1 uncharacterized protein LOC121597885 [Anopheles merus]XP_061511666.1 uncharacterized protein LOC133390940 [Anopheles gambiae]